MRGIDDAVIELVDNNQILDGQGGGDKCVLIRTVLLHCMNA